MVQAQLNIGRAVEAVVIGGSAGSVQALRQILPGLPAGFPPVLVVVHVPSSPATNLARLFDAECTLRVQEAESSASLERGSIYFAPPDYHLLVERDGRSALSVDAPVHFSRPAIDVLFESAADVYGAALAAVVLSGASADGAAGLCAIDRAGGFAFVQDPATAEVPLMPNAAASAVPNARVLSVAGILHGLRALPIRGVLRS